MQKCSIMQHEVLIEAFASAGAAPFRALYKAHDTDMPIHIKQKLSDFFNEADQHVHRFYGTEFYELDFEQELIVLKELKNRIDVFINLHHIQT